MNIIATSPAAGRFLTSAALKESPAVHVFSSDKYVLPLPEGHRFPMAKYRLLRERVEASGLLGPGELVDPPIATDAQLELAHDAD